MCETTEAVHGMLAASTLPEASAASATMDSPATATSAGVGQQNCVMIGFVLSLSLCCLSMFNAGKRKKMHFF